MLKILILLALSLNLAFAKTRFTQDEKDKFLADVKQQLEAYKKENKGNIDFEIIKPALYDELDVMYKKEKFTRLELINMKKQYEALSAARNKDSSGAKEQAFYQFLNQKIEEANNNPLEKYKEGQICNNWGCEDGLKCAPAPTQEFASDNKKCSKANCACENDNECDSRACTYDSDKKRSTCEMVKVCYRPLSMGQSCVTNPVCGEGDCLPFSSKSAGIGECVDVGGKCKGANDCCSESCNKGRCVESYVCKECVKNGSKPTRGQNCCEGLYQDLKGVCVPDVPPIVPKATEYKNTLMKKVFYALLNSVVDSTYAIEAATGEETGGGGSGGAASATQTNGADVYTSEEKRGGGSGGAASATQTNGADDYVDAYGHVNANKDKYENFQAKSLEPKAKEKKALDLKLERASDFKTCDIKLRDDFYNYLKKENLLDLEIALLAFDFMFSGENGVNDYWKKTSSEESSSIYGRLHTASLEHMKIRKATNDNIKTSTHKLTCLCLDAMGYKNITDPDKKKFFENECEEYKVTLAGSVCYKSGANGVAESCVQGTEGCTCTDSNINAISGCYKVSDGKRETCQEGSAGCTCTDETASGIKGKRMIVEWTAKLRNFNQTLTVDNTNTYKSIKEVSEWASSTDWNTVQNKTYTLFNFNIKNPQYTAAAMGAIVGALLAAGVIAILGGFAAGTLINSWLAVGIIVSTSLTTGTGVWLIASLKGAWISKHPEIHDQFVRTYGCGKKETCAEYRRELHQPYNEVCGIHTSANACIKNFLVFYDENNQANYVVDPWVPAGMSKTYVLKDSTDAQDYAHKLEQGFRDALNRMRGANPLATGGGGKDGGEYVAEAYMWAEFINWSILEKYAPNIGREESKYKLNEEVINSIKRAAIGFAINAQFVKRDPVGQSTAGANSSKYCAVDPQDNVTYCSPDSENLDKFADYVYEYHFLYPKTSRPKEISYPTVGLTTYLGLMSDGVAANLAVGASEAAKQFSDLNQKYLKDYLSNLQLYKDNAINAGNGSVVASIDAEIAKVNAELAQNEALKGILDSSDIAAKLGLSNGVASNGSGSTSGKSSSALTSGQNSYANAVSTLRNARKEQLKKLDNYKKAMAKNAARAAKMATASKNFNDSFLKPLTGNRGSGNGYGGSGVGGRGYGAGGAGAGGENTGDSKDGASSQNLGANIPAYPGADGMYDPNAAGSGSGSKSKAGSGSDSSSSGSSLAGSSGNGMSDEDARRLAEAIDARDKSGKDKYKTQEGSSIFERVTNAYIRNYDKILDKKKKSDKDVIEKN
jgi:hypothetical protein